MLFVSVAVLAGIVWWLLSRNTLRARDVIVAVVLAAWTVGVGVKVYLDRLPDAPEGPEGSAIAFRLPEWRAESSSLPVAEPIQTRDEGSAMTAAPVAALIGGLEARLASEPNDAKGWALLAQAYTFVGDAAAAEHALERAVALGFDEQELRERMRSARREPESRSWIERTIGG